MKRVRLDYYGRPGLGCKRTGRVSPSKKCGIPKSPTHINTDTMLLMHECPSCNNRYFVVETEIIDSEDLPAILPPLKRA